MIYKFLLAIKNKPELIVLSVMILVIMMLIIPLPTYLVDFLIGLNITIALLIFMSSFYIKRILNFMTFPALLLITTLFRLALSISTSRLILLCFLKLFSLAKVCVGMVVTIGNANCIKILSQATFLVIELGRGEGTLFNVVIFKLIVTNNDEIFVFIVFLDIRN